MPGWVQLVLGAAAFVTSMGVLWNKVLNPLRKAGNRAEQMYPLLVELTKVFADHPHYFQVLDDIADQFRSNHGSSLMDVVKSLQVAAQENQKAAEVLKVGVEASRVLAERDREQLMRLIILLDRLDAKVSGGRGALDRIELDQKGVAADLIVAQSAVAGVASNLAAAQAAVDDVASNLVVSDERTEINRAKVAEDLRVAQMAVDAVAAELETNARRLDAAKALVAANLRLAQAAVDGVADDLLASHVRADATRGSAGEAADAASRSASDEATRAWVAAQQQLEKSERRKADPAAEQAWKDSGLPDRRRPA